MTSRFTGRHMALILVCFFLVVITVNVVMARFASSTFGGVVVENSYVASQHFNRWLEEAKAQKALGREASIDWRDDGVVAILLTDAPDAAAVTAIARHPLGRLPDRTLRFMPDGGGRFVSAETLPPGRWQLRFEVRNGGRIWRHEEELLR